MPDTESQPGVVANGAALAALLAAGIGTCALGLIIILNESGNFPVPALYPPAGGVSSRTTLAVVIWLIAWAVLHSRWKNRQLGSRAVPLLSLLLIAAGIVLTFPPVWQLF